MYSYQYVIYDILWECEQMLTLENIVPIRKIFINAAQINTDFNNVYWFQLLVLMISSISGVLCIGFRFGCNFILGNFSYNVGLMDIEQLQVLLFTMVVLSSIGAKKENCISLIRLKANKILLHCSDKCKNEVEMLLSSLSSLNIYISAGLFHLNYSFWTNICGIIVTYLVILIQFEIEYQGYGNYNRLEATLTFTRY